MARSSVIGSMVAALGRAPRHVRLALGLVIFLNLVVPSVLINYHYSASQLLLATLLFDVCLFPTFRYVLGETGLPILPVLCLAFAAQYAIPIFTQEPGVPLADGFRELDDVDIIAALGLSIVGVVTLQIAYYSLNAKKAVQLLPHVRLPLDRRRSEIYCILIVLLSVVLTRAQTVLSEQMFLQFSAIIGLIQNQLMIAIGILSYFVFSGTGTKVHRILLYAVVGVAAVKGFSTTMMESMMVPPAVLLMSKWYYTRRLPVSIIVIIAALFLFLSPVKRDIRSTIGEDRAVAAEVSTADRMTDWVTQAITYWSEVATGTRDFIESTSDASSRTDLIHTFAHIHSLTPSVVPYQYGDSYGYLAIAWIPRVLWPEKPIANSANNFFAVAYNVSTEEGVKTSSFGVTLMGEGYMNFGFPGVVLVMIVLGVVTSLLEDVFAGPESGSGGQAIFLATFVYFLNGIGTSAELLFGGLVQNLVACVVLLWWVRAKPAAKRSRRFKLRDRFKPELEPAPVKSLTP